MGVTVRAWQQLVEAGRAAPSPALPATAADLCTIMYTSGTTGKPKARLVSVYEIPVYEMKAVCVLVRGEANPAYKAVCVLVCGKVRPQRP